MSRFLRLKAWPLLFWHKHFDTRGGSMINSSQQGATADAGQPFGRLALKHPCFSGEAHVKYGRIHLPVSPACNIQCKFCKRSMNKSEKRPGVTGGLLSVDQVVEWIEKALRLCPDITVAGIAGPGDTLATPHALDAFERIHELHPELINCMSTNGLLLERHVERIAKVGVKTLTVTVNAVEPEILQHICSKIYLDGTLYTGLEAAELLIKAQLAGIRKASALGIVIKINTVLITGINDRHVGEVARQTAAAGAELINVIPLIPQNEMSHLPAPTCLELHEAREAAERHLPVFRHCLQCRADACGIPGSGIDFAGELYEEPLQTFSHG